MNCKDCRRAVTCKYCGQRESCRNFRARDLVPEVTPEQFAAENGGELKYETVTESHGEGDYIEIITRRVPVVHLGVMYYTAYPYLIGGDFRNQYTSPWVKMAPEWYGVELDRRAVVSFGIGDIPELLAEYS